MRENASGVNRQENQSATCGVCASRDCIPFASQDGCDLVRCQSCGLVFMAPPPADAAAMYADPYAGATESYFTKVESKLRRSRGRVKRLIRHIPGGPAGKKFLDIGCNGGFMTEAAREAGLSATGLDPDGHAIAWAREHFPENSYIHGLLEEAGLGDGGFDAVYCSEVIEHAPDSNRFVAALAATLKPQGVVYLTTPDIDHWRRPRDIRKWDAFCPPSHCVFFNPANLARLLAAHGLVVVWRAVSLKPGIKLIAARTG